MPGTWGRDWPSWITCRVGLGVTPDQFKQMMVTFLPELATAEMTTETKDGDTIYRFKKRVGTKG